MRAILEKLRQVNDALPAGVTPEQLSNFENTLGRRLPGALRSLYQDHNGEPGGKCLFRLLPLHDAYPVGDGRWCFWESRYDPTGDGADYEFRDGSVRCQHRTYPSVQAFLEDQLPTTERIQDASLPEAFLQAERLDCCERAEAIQVALAEARVESASALLGYLRDDDSAVLVAACEWMSRHGVQDAIPSLSLLDNEAARRALETLGARLVEYEVQEPVPEEFRKVVSECFDGETGGRLTLLQRSPDSPWEWVRCSGGRVRQVPEFPQAVRERPGLYFGSCDAFGALQLALEVIANSVDQFLQGRASQIRVQYDDWFLEVEDDGEGYPLDSESGERYLTDLHHSPTADDHAPHVHLITQGIGLAPVNAVCSTYQVESVREGQGHRLAYESGNLVCKQRADLDFSRGTRVRLTLDRQLWAQGFASGPLRRRLFDFVHLIPGLMVTLNEERFHARHGLLDLASFHGEWLGERILNYEGKNDFLMLQVAAVGETDRRMDIQSWVNGACTEEHGSHVEGALEAFREAGWRPARVLVHVIMLEPEYAGPTRRKLRSPRALRQVRALLRHALH